MCGIAGIVSYKDSDKLSFIKQMLESIRHRGPDDEGMVFFGIDGSEKTFGGSDTPEKVYKSGHLYSPEGKFTGKYPQNSYMVFGHRLLSIIDLSPASHQPMCSQNKDIWIVYNGEIYNYIELREELIKMGHKFHSATDTEVLLNAYRQWGYECLKRLNGMWSFVIYDKNKNLLFGSRDRFGVKPFYYFNNEDVFSFASEIKSILKLPFLDNKINDKAVFDYLYNGLEENDTEGFIKGIFELRPSEAFELMLDNGKIRKWKYYELEFNDSYRSFNTGKLTDIYEIIKEKIYNAVRVRLRSDVPVGSCLSGGLDSSAIVCAINDLIKKENNIQIGDRQKVFTACFDQKEVDESSWARIVVEKTDASWHRTYPLVNEFIQDLEDMIYIQDIPFVSTSIYAQYRVMKTAKENNVKVLLDGQGGDELFTGYHGHYISFFNEMVNNFDIVSLIREFNCLSNSPVKKDIVLRSLLKRYMPFKNSKMRLNSFFDNCFDKELYLKNRDRSEEVFNKIPEKLNQFLFNSFTKGSLKNLLRYEDRNSMRFSVESRVPFTDDTDLVEYIFSLPSKFKIQNGFSKYLLRQASKGFVPDAIRKRKDKMGFFTPEKLWLYESKNALKRYITDDLEGYIDHKALIKSWDEIFEAEKHNILTMLWRVINFAVWKKVYKI